MEKNNVKPTEKQIATLKVLKKNPKLPLGKAMREGGYSPKTSLNPKQNFIDLKGTAIAHDKWREALRNEGLDEYFLIQKYKKWFSHPNPTIQLKVKDDLRRDLCLPIGNQQITTNQLDIGNPMTLKFVEDDK